MEIITTNQGQVCTIVNVAATPIVVSRKVGDELQLEGKDFVITDFEDFASWFELETVRHDHNGTVYLNEEQGRGRLYCLREKCCSSLHRPKICSFRERIR